MNPSETNETPATGASLIDQIRTKLTDRKQAWSRAGRAITGATAPRTQRLPPGQRLVTDWPVLDLGIQPDVAKSSFSLTIDGAVEHPVTLDWHALMALPQETSVSDMHCVTTWSRYDNHWQGVAITTILDLVRPRAEASHVLFNAYDDYTTNLRLDQVATNDSYLVHSWQGQPISRQHGGPLRVLVPRYYLWKSAKWIRRITIATADHPGFWETRGYNNNADPWLEERYS
ncbi:sulfite oxidase-like oxidoreductase [Acidiphilium sp.]|uniref:sulfite oxidase-like oxidoreductase n=1 Tax=Acidiphilium sp. TaxID=527 RepID=UPI003D0063FA